MKITDQAAQTILAVMKSKGLDPKAVFLEIGLFDGGLGMGFTKERKGKSYHFGELTAVIGYSVDGMNLTVDFGEIDGRKGLVFLEDNHVQN